MSRELWLPDLVRGLNIHCIVSGKLSFWLFDWGFDSCLKLYVFLYLWKHFRVIRGPWTRLSGSNVANTAACLPPLCLWLAKVTSTSNNLYSGIPFCPKVSKSANLPRKGVRHSPCAESVFSAQVTLRNEPTLSVEYYSRAVINKRQCHVYTMGPQSPL